MIKLVDILEDINPFHQDYGNYLFGANKNYYGKAIEDDTEEEIKIQMLLAKWVVGEDTPEIVPYFEKLYKAKKYYPQILDPGNIHVWKGVPINNDIKQFIKTNTFVPYNGEIQSNTDELLVSKNYYMFDNSLGAHSWSTDKEISSNFFFHDEGSVLLTTTTNKGKFLFKPFVMYYLSDEFAESDEDDDDLDEYLSKVSKLEATGEKEIVGIGKTPCKIIISKNEYLKIVEI